MRRATSISTVSVFASLILGAALAFASGCYVTPAPPPPAGPPAYGSGYPPPQDQTPSPTPPTYDPGYPAPSQAPPPPPPPPPAYPPAPAPVAATPDYGPSYADVSAVPPGSNVRSVDVFYNELTPYGSWYDDPSYGWVFAPASPAYLPYSNGRWVSTDYGFTWVSSDPFGWATDHYGRWRDRKSVV